MTLRLTPETQRFVDEQLKAGAFPSVEAVVEAALEQMRESAELEDATIAAINEGDAQADRGECVDYETARAMFLGPRPRTGTGRGHQ
ncbi:MAG: type II toxin-antitoxin system ParD family antitoxin [Phycisphaerae bacterium]|nr:hypothetical protein [Tepidisphaeraceae bacterium]